MNRVFNTKYRNHFCTAIALLACSLASASHAGYNLPAKYQGNCPQGYSQAITEPADVPANYAGNVEEFALPKNVCVCAAKKTATAI
jgi:hypothetical protein